ncbi:MAG TPA: LapA family protein [Actinospica sp.]|jgi:uncharacterized integral membrane protein|nr:LapA family protein [Actinospica sp.]
MSANIPPAEPQPQQSRRATAKDTLTDRLARPKVFIGGLITIATVWFIIANNSRVRIRLWVPWVSARLWVVLLLTFVAGALVGFLFARRRGRRRD